MKSDITGILKARMMGEKVSALEEVLTLLKSDVATVMENYMRIAGELYIGADIDEGSGDMIISIHAKARELYECGTLLKA